MILFSKKAAALVLLSALLTGCSQTQSLKKQLADQSLSISKLKDINNTLSNELILLKQQEKPLSLIRSASVVLELIKEKNFSALSAYIDDTKGVRFSPYAHIDIQNDKVFTKTQIAAITQNTSEYVWGIFDGSGEPIHLNFNDYYKQFIYSKDFINPDRIGYKEFVSSGTLVNNLKEVYKDGNFVEFYSKGSDPSQMDWASLILVFENINNNWCLVGIVHSQWTI